VKKGKASDLSLPPLPQKGHHTDLRGKEIWGARRKGHERGAADLGRKKNLHQKKRALKDRGQSETKINKRGEKRGDFN